MDTVFHYGTERSLHFEFENGSSPDAFGLPRGDALADPAEALERALAEPLDYPPLARCITPSDRVVLALDEGVPQVMAIVNTTISHLLRVGMDLDGITILQTEADVQAGINEARQSWPAEWQQRIHVVTHDPNDRGQMAYLATTDEGETIFLNRVLTDADVVLPIGCLRRESVEYHGIHGSLFPTFSTQQEILRYRSPDSLQPRSKKKVVLDHEVDEVAWLLGVTFTIQIVPAGGDRILHVLAGHPPAVRARGRELYREAWVDHAPRRAGLVVAAIEGGSLQQTWHNFGRALAAALRLVEKDGAIAICCDLTSEPGAGVKHLAAADSREDALRMIRKARPADTLSAIRLARAQEKTTVYLLSQLDATLVEKLDMAPIAQSDELLRLVHNHPSCILLSNAPHAAVTVRKKE
jgi:nickel-dependent lactate racemase